MLDAAIEKLRNETGCPCAEIEQGKSGRELCIKGHRKGYVLAIAIVPSIIRKIDGENGDTMNSSLEINDTTAASSDTQSMENYVDDKLMQLEHQIVIFADHLRMEGWAFGLCGEDIVIVLSVDDAQLHTSVGQRSRRLLSKAKIDDVFKLTKRYFQEKKYALGLLITVEKYREILTGKYVSPQESEETNITMGLYIGLMSIVVMIAVIICVVCIKSIGEKFKPKRRGLETAASGMSAAATPAMMWAGAGGAGGGGGGGSQL
ncbi:PREDICTED: uncharacterized protein LOC106805919 [Priapulus caudatus]|uniref:Uncharacterized protein LOC106805919 n=1 Tax=Priapulus caudatus TaxID=37621 RepID=A0ABM1DTA5_PRICU|nr:PREDICTED: uncharacterized protein LOC106805919 [Priapulus caudatus]